MCVCVCGGGGGGGGGGCVCVVCDATYKVGVQHRYGKVVTTERQGQSLLFNTHYDSYIEGERHVTDKAHPQKQVCVCVCE